MVWKGTRSLVEPQLIDIGGRCLALYSVGEGSPAVVFETGLIAESNEWEDLVEMLLTERQVFWYDRAGRGRSDPAERPRTVVELAGDLSYLLQAAAVCEPVILVAHSMGGLAARIFADRYPDQIAALVLVEPTHEAQFEIISSLLPPPHPDEPNSLNWFRWYWSRGYQEADQNPEGLDVVQSCRLAAQVESLHDLPLILLHGGDAFNHLYLPQPINRRLLDAMRAMHEQTVRLSSRSQIVEVPSSGHFIQRDQPQAILDAVRCIIDLL